MMRQAPKMFQQTGIFNQCLRSSRIKNILNTGLYEIMAYSEC